MSEPVTRIDLKQFDFFAEASALEQFCELFDVYLVEDVRLVVVLILLRQVLCPCLDVDFLTLLIAHACSFVVLLIV